eukprot:sb/3468808/
MSLLLLLMLQKPTKTSKQLPMRNRYLGHVTGYQSIRDQYFLIWSVPVIESESLTTVPASASNWEINTLLYKHPPSPRPEFEQRTCLEFELDTIYYSPRTDRIFANQEILVPDWLITSHLTEITGSDWLFTCFGRFLLLTPFADKGYSGFYGNSVVTEEVRVALFTQNLVDERGVPPGPLERTVSKISNSVAFISYDVISSLFQLSQNCSTEKYSRFVLKWMLASTSASKNSRGTKFWCLDLVCDARY